MKLPLEITFRGIRKTENLENFIRKKAAKLDQICDDLMSCRVAVERTQKHQRSGSPYRVRIQMRVPPGHELVAKKETGQSELQDPLTKVLSETFESAYMQLRRQVEKRRGHIKAPSEEKAMGIVVKLFREQGYGFLKTIDTGKDVYFHRNSVIENGYDRLEMGTAVRFVEVPGEEGPQASTVAIVDKPGRRVRESTDPQIDVPLGWEGKKNERNDL